MNIFTHLGDIPSRPPCNCAHLSEALRQVGVLCNECLARAEQPAQLGSIPRGFYEIAAQAECSDASPAFIRGMLMARKDYDALPMTAASGTLSQTNISFPPRWALYGGPITNRAVARDWQTSMQFWAPGQGLIWIPFDEPCIVQSWRIPWPANAVFQWTWVREVYQPQRVIKSPSTGKYVWEGQGG